MAGKGYSTKCEPMKKGDDTRELPKPSKGMQVLGKKGSTGKKGKY